ncbi:MAG: SDR family oxidoreductase [Deltaproteobacteria bacterium]|nr:SDR family oxidoreductase [Deltaproteobacteria bacterium]
MDLEDKIAVVTGGGGGIGEGVCLCLAREGAHVVVSDIKEDLAQSVSVKVKEADRKSLAVKTDVSREDECNALIDTAIREMGGLDILVCSAGTAGLQFMSSAENASDIENISLDVWNTTMDVNLKGVFLTNRAAIPHFKRQKSGKIINISSDAGRKGGTTLPVYGASKAGVINLSQAIAMQVAPFSINVNTICPGLIWTPLWAEGMKRMLEMRPEPVNVSPEEAWNLMVNTSTPLGRPQTPEDIGNLAVFLASDRAKEITGQAFNVDGGLQLN